MRKLAAVLMIVVAVASYAGTNAASVAGSYRGPDETYGLVLEVAADGRLHGQYVEEGRLALVYAFEVNGSSFTARASFDDGSLRMISGSVTSRGIKVNDVFFERL